MDCEFKIIRKTTSRKVIAISIWKSNPTYIFNISQGMAWWAVNSRILFPGWNVRFYIDKDIRKHMKNDIEDWDVLITSLSRFNHIELWFYDCESGKKDINHIGTFGSLVRFHALTDNTLDCRIFRNVEQLTSPKEARLIHQWVLSDKDYIIWFDIEAGYPCGYNNKNLCKKTGLENKYMILATFGSKITFVDYLKDSYKVCIKYDLLNYPYGVDEICLTILLKKYLNMNNTFLIPRQRLNQIFPSSYTDVYNIIADALEIQGIPSVLNSEISKIKDIEKLYNIILKLRRNYNSDDIDTLQREMNDYYLEIFLNDLELDNFLEKIDDQNKAVSLVLKYVIFENIDWPGGLLKNKTLKIFSKPERMTLTQAKNAIVMGRKRMKRPPLSEEQLTIQAERDIENNYNKELENYNINKSIFLKNIRNIYLSRDQNYIV